MKLVETVGGLEAAAPGGRIASVYWPALTGMSSDTLPYPWCISIIGCEGLPNGYRYTSSGVPGDRSAQRTQPWSEPAAEAAEAVATTGPPSRAVTAVSRTRRLPSLILGFLPP